MLSDLLIDSAFSTMLDLLVASHKAPASPGAITSINATIDSLALETCTALVREVSKLKFFLDCVILVTPDETRNLLRIFLLLLRSPNNVPSDEPEFSLSLPLSGEYRTYSAISRAIFTQILTKSGRI